MIHSTHVEGQSIGGGGDDLDVDVAVVVDVDMLISQWIALFRCGMHKSPSCACFNLRTWM